MVGSKTDKTEHPINRKTYIMQAVSHLAIMYDPDVLELVASETIDSEGDLPALCATLEVKGAVSSAAQPAPHTLFLIVASLRHNIPRRVKLRVVQVYLHSCAQFDDEQHMSSNTSIVVGGNFGGLLGVEIECLVQSLRFSHGEAYQLARNNALSVLCASS